MSRSGSVRRFGTVWAPKVPPTYTDPPQIVLHVPVPPSANNLFVNAARGRVKSAAYKAWRDEAGWRVRMELPPYLDKPGVRVLIEVDLPRRRDLDNTIKPILDLLVYVSVLADDSLVDDLRIIRRGDKKMAAISIWPA